MGLAQRYNDPSPQAHTPPPPPPPCTATYYKHAVSRAPGQAKSSGISLWKEHLDKGFHGLRMYRPHPASVAASWASVDMPRLSATSTAKRQLREAIVYPLST